MDGVDYREHTVLYVDDDKEERACFESECAGVYSVVSVGDIGQAHHVIESQKICVIVCDSRMPAHKGGPVDTYAGLHFLKKVRTRHPLILRALVTGIPADSRSIPFSLLNEAGVDKWIDKLERPCWRMVVGELIEKHVSEQLLACSAAPRRLEWFPGVIGDSTVMWDLMNRIEQVCDSGLIRPILIVGESGVGKELVAQAIHNRGSRGNKPYYVFSKAEISGDMARAALFGYARGAFTGAYTDTAGAFEMADRGTLVIDDVQNLSLDVQSDLLRVIERGTFRRLGAGEKEREADFQIICTMNEDPHRLVRRGRLRHDFYYRISSVTINVPPLRERRECIPVLVKEFIQEFNRESDSRRRDGIPKHIGGIEPAAMQTLLLHDWRRNNVRELKNAVLSAWINASRNVICKEDLRGCIDGVEATCPDEVPRKETPWKLLMRHRTRLLKTELIRAILWAHIISGGNIREAARLLGIAESLNSSRVRLHHYIRKHDLEGMLEQRSKEILRDCMLKAEGNLERAAEALCQRLSELFPYTSDPEIDQERFAYILRRFKIA